MGIGSAEKHLEISQPPDSVFIQARRALEGIGKIKEMDEDALFLRGSTRYGLQKVRLKVFIKADGEGSRLTIKALADDVWGKGARKGCERLLEALGYGGQ
ncbi:MAG: hypothetical protein GEU71_14405 [Actinobacteria bacterium]|nr:hypothetical protein [Actinomycetota bacterium]